MSLEENTTKSYINFVLQKLHIYHFDIVFFFKFNYFRLFGVENNVWEGGKSTISLTFLGLKH